MVFYKKKATIIKIITLRCFISKSSGGSAGLGKEKWPRGELEKISLQLANFRLQKL